LLKDWPQAQIGGQKIPYPPKDLAGMVTLLRHRKHTSYLALEPVTQGGAGFISQVLPSPITSPDNYREKDLRKFLRKLDAPLDIISIDMRGLPFDHEELWRYMLGGRDPKREFGAGAAIDYGIKKVAAGSSIIINLSSEEGKQLWYKLRPLFHPLFISHFAVMLAV
jgi:hypothetical protein